MPLICNLSASAGLIHKIMQPEDYPDIKVFWIPFFQKRYDPSETSIINKKVFASERNDTMCPKNEKEEKGIVGDDKISIKIIKQNRMIRWRS